MKNKTAMVPALLLGIAIANAPAASAQSSATREAARDKTDAIRFSDRDRMADWNKGEEALERALKPDQSKEQYREQLKEMGYTITAVNYDKPDYVEWEVVKGNDSYEVQIDFDGSKSSKVEVAPNMWRADATKQALRGKKAAAAGKGDARFSDRDRRAGWQKGEEALERALKPGQSKEHYRDELKKLGYQITATNYDQPDYVEWEVVKADESYEIQMTMSGNKATKIDVAMNMWRAEPTERALSSGTTTKSERRTTKSEGATTKR